ncbi:Gfo/Idh/MocA family protein [Draconibacterium halophilum]|uniref:Gfo/Idh/MocA family oxidoreductase n=1 Tax=Draconibacterium halophilum TaxID=2706887 RepID=A0A6C0RC47_9BACT|nr:Gfo/Idh/MocA family oxidoreductase [Draconibacterium halophilum]QIA07596.1 Gfo/Idh/MocA family oxidoreductase [Draconibacterium halophilum]
MKKTTRRTFLKSATTAGVGAAIIPHMISCSPNDRLNFAVIGVGGRGHASWSQVPSESIVAMCDVDDRMSAKGYEACPNAKKYKDFRLMFDEMANQIDAVIIATPDHTHFPAAMAAMELGKHVFVEKPLAHNIWQLRTLKKAAKHYGIVSQMGNQGHTTNGIRLVKEWYEAGVLGEVKEVIAWQGKIDFEKDIYFAKPNSFPPQKDAIPEGLNWDLWQGPVSERPFNNLYAPRTWRGFYDYGNGKLGDWCCHTLDAPFWSLDMGLPHTVDAQIKDPVPDHSFVAQESVVTWQFGARGNKAPLTMKWLEGFDKPELKPEWGLTELPDRGMIMIGDKNTLYTGGRPNNPRLLMPEEEWQDFLKNAPEKTIPRVGEEQPVQEWIDAIKNDSLPGSNFDYASSLMEMAQVGVLAQRFGGTINYDAKNMKATDRPELDKYIKEPVRKGWSYGENL